MQVVYSQSQVNVVQPQGDLSDENAVKFHNQLTSALFLCQNSTLLVDLEQVEFLDIKGLLALIAALLLSRKLNCRYSLCSLPPSTQLALELTQLDRFFEIFDNRQAFQQAGLSHLSPGSYKLLANQKLA